VLFVIFSSLLASTTLVIVLLILGIPAVGVVVVLAILLLNIGAGLSIEEFAATASHTVSLMDGSKALLYPRIVLILISTLVPASFVSAVEAVTFTALVAVHRRLMILIFSIVLVPLVVAASTVVAPSVISVA
jgi:hypothetical protein